MALENIKEQQVIINSREQAILVTARPGRGKTTVALLTASRIISDEEINPSQTILFLTFSRNAVYQIEQASGFILDKEVKNRLWISTYHAFMWWVLTTFGRFHDLPANLEVMRETKGKAARNSATLIDIDESEMSFYLAKNYSAIAYDDFAPLTLSILNNSQVLREVINNRFPVVIVDEFQDTNQEQWQLIKLLSENSRLICFADPNQMIFRWRGASGNRLNQLVAERNAKEYFLQNKCKRTEEQNLLDFAEALLDNKIGSASEQIAWKKRFLVSYPGLNALGFYLKAQIRSFYYDFQRRKSDKQFPSIAIAAYSNNTAKAIQDALAKSTPKAPKTYNCNLLEGQVDDAIDELLIHLAAWASGGATYQLLQAIKLVGGLLIPDITKANNSLAGLLSPEKLLSKEIQSKGIAKEVLEIFEAMSRPIEDPKEAIIQSVLAIEKLMERKAISSVISVEDLHGAQLKILQTLETIPNKSALVAIDLVRNRLSSERIQIDILDRVLPTRGIISSTLHKLKGREFDYVCIVTQVGDRLRSKDDDESDARKLMYVALSRARYDARILYVESNPCFLLNPFLPK